jgi:hypothetical protein
MNPSGVALLDIGGDCDHHLLGGQGNSSHFPILELKHDFARVNEAFDRLLFLKPLIGKHERLPGVQTVELGFKRWLGPTVQICENHS